MSSISVNQGPVKKFGVSSNRRAYFVLTQDISFRDFDNNPVKLSQGEAIFVDESTMTAWAKGIAFTIRPAEYAPQQ